MNLYSMKDIAEEIGKDKSNVYRYVKKNNIAHTDVKDRTLLFNTTQKNTIITGMSNQEVKNVAQQPHGQQSKNVDAKDQVISALQDNIKNLKDQNNLLTKQLENKDKQLDKAQMLIDQQQQLNLSTQKFLEQQKQQQNKEKEKETTDNQQEEQPKKGFFKRLFGNK